MKQKLLAAIAALALAGSSLLAQTTIPTNHPCIYHLTLSGSPYIATNDVIIPESCVMTVDPGVEIIMAENTHLIVRGKATFAGTAAMPIHIHAQDSTWGNILLDSTLVQKSTFDHVIFENARTSVRTGEEPGAIYGYYSAMEVTNCHFMNNLRCVSNYQCPNFVIKNCILDSTNKGEKIHGQYCDGALVEGNTLYATNGDNDAIDFDASNNVTIRNNILYHGGDDGIDIGQCDSVGCNGVLVQGNYIYCMFNKGVSNGENCLNITIDHNVIAGCAMGIGAKSGAHVTADHNTLYNNRLGVSSYQHLDQIWGPGNLVLTNSIIAGGDTIYHVDPTAYLAMSYCLSPDTLIPGTGNIKGNPAFVNPGLMLTSDFHLMTGSAAINAGDPTFAHDPDGSRSDIGALFFGSAGILNFSSNTSSLTIYPNPTSGVVRIRYIDTRSASSKTELSMIDLTGRVLYKESMAADSFSDGLSLDLGKHPAGVYYLQIRSDKGISSGKLVLE